MKQTHLTQALVDYAEQISLHEHPSLLALRHATAHLPLAHMQSPPLQVQFLQFLLHMMQAKRALELGTYTGYTTLGLALALPADGEVITCDINPTWTNHAPPFWEEAKQTHKIQLRLAPALTTLQSLPLTEPFDFIFIDADKTHYVDYYEYALKLIKPHGIIAIDNIFWGGLVIDPNENGSQTREIRRLNEKIKQDERVECALIPIGDGVFLIRLKH